jgi:hypothetical protein
MDQKLSDRIKNFDSSQSRLPVSELRMMLLEALPAVEDREQREQRDEEDE